MSDLTEAFGLALGLVISLDAALLEIVCRSLAISLAAVVLASAIGLPLGAAIAVWRFPGRSAVVVMLNAL
ncbi:MAG: hypothetical protein QF376_04025, partial [Anaerolineales bacterium]|nr:hypothetical protein [Anaerolineales bacterium]